MTNHDGLHDLPKHSDVHRRRSDSLVEEWARYEVCERLSVMRERCHAKENTDHCAQLIEACTFAFVPASLHPRVVCLVFTSVRIFDDVAISAVVRWIYELERGKCIFPVRYYALRTKVKPEEIRW